MYVRITIYILIIYFLKYSMNLFILYLSVYFIRCRTRIGSVRRSSVTHTHVGSSGGTRPRGGRTRCITRIGSAGRGPGETRIHTSARWAGRSRVVDGLDALHASVRPDEAPATHTHTHTSARRVGRSRVADGLGAIHASVRRGEAR